MTLTEFCEKYGYSESTVKAKWTQVQLKLIKDKGIKVVKKGRGDKAEYIEEIDNYPRAVTMFHENATDLLVTTDLNMINWDFHVFLAIVTTPMYVFRGTIEQLLQYMMAPISAESKKKAQEAIDSLIEKGFIGLIQDKSTSEGYFTLTLQRDKEVKMKISYQMLLTCKQLADEENKRSWVPLLKTWLGVQMLSELEQYRVEDLQKLTGLSTYQIRESNKILTKHELYRTSRAFYTFNRCIGTKVDLNGFYNEDIAELPAGYITSDGFVKEVVEIN